MISGQTWGHSDGIERPGRTALDTTQSQAGNASQEIYSQNVKWCNRVFMQILPRIVDLGFWPASIPLWQDALHKMPPRNAEECLQQVCYWSDNAYNNWKIRSSERRIRYCNQQPGLIPARYPTFFWYPARPDSVLKIIGYRVTRNGGYYPIFQVGIPDDYPMTIKLISNDYPMTITNFWSIFLDDHWSKMIYRPKVIV